MACKDCLWYKQKYVSVPNYGACHPLLASFFCAWNPEYTKLRECSTQGKIVSKGEISGAKTVTTGNLIDFPKISAKQRAEVAIRCTRRMYSDPPFDHWADKWLSGEDRTKESAYRCRTAHLLYMHYYALRAAMLADQEELSDADFLLCCSYAADAVSCAGALGVDLLQLIRDVVDDE